AAGQFSLRGGIVDLWPPNLDSPVRIEFFGDTVDSIRTFDPETQLSVEQLRSISVAPMREYSASPQDLKDWAFFARDRFSAARFSRNLRDRTDFAGDGETFAGWEFMLPLSRPLKSSVFDLLSDHILVIDEPTLVSDSLSELLETFRRRHEVMDELGE